MRLCQLALYLLISLVFSVCEAQFPPPPTSAAVGVEAGGRPPPFCDVVKHSNPFKDEQGEVVDVDESGWPKADGKLVVFDLRPTFAWAPPIDDPEKKIPQNLDGVWKLSFSGIANVSIADGSFSGLITSIQFDNTTNITTADINYPKGEALMVLYFNNTQRTSSDPKGSGVVNISIIAPYCDQKNPTLFTQMFIKALQPFDHL